MWTLLVTSVLAQQEACAPVPAAELLAALDAAESSLDANRYSDATRQFDDAAEKARCLAEPVTAGALSRIGWGRAEIAAMDMDEDLAWTWIRLALESGATGPPTRVRENHPLRRAFQDARDPTPVSGPEGVTLYLPKKGVAFADGKPITEPRLTASTPHLIQIFVKEEPYLGHWQVGSAFPKANLTPIIQAGHRTRRTVEAGDELPPPNWKPAKLDTREAYEDWIKKHPKGPWLEDARDGIDDLDWAQAKEVGTPLAAKTYIYDHPDGLHVDEANFFIEELAYRSIVTSKKRKDWEDFIEEFPKGIYGSEARVQLELIDWEVARKANTEAAYAAFLEQHPDELNADLARKIAEERGIDEARAKGTDSALKRFLERWPQGAHAVEARAILGEVQFQRVRLDIQGEVDPAVADKVRADLLDKLGARKIEVTDDDADDVAHMRVELTTVPNNQVVDIGAVLNLEYADLKRPLVHLVIASKVLPSADLGAELGTMLTANLRSFERWGAGEPEEEPAGTEDDKAPIIIKK